MQISLRRLMRHESGSDTVARHLGISKLDFLIKMESLRQPDMNTDNFGLTWCVDHIVPLRLFDLTKPEDISLAWNHNNLIPMYNDHNFEKEHCLHISEEILSYQEKNEWTEKLMSVIKKNKVDFSLYNHKANRPWLVKPAGLP